MTLCVMWLKVSFSLSVSCFRNTCSFFITCCIFFQLLYILIYVFLLILASIYVCKCERICWLCWEGICLLTHSVTNVFSSFLLHGFLILLFGNEKFNSTSNNKILSSVINFILHSKRFDGPLFWKKKIHLILDTLFILCVCVRIVR